MSPRPTVPRDSSAAPDGGGMSRNHEFGPLDSGLLSTVRTTMKSGDGLIVGSVSNEPISAPSPSGVSEPDNEGGAMHAKTDRYIRPGFFMTHVVNPINRRLGISTMLIVRGRKSGETRVTPLGQPLEYAGARYLVSGRGQTQWVRNLRAAGRCELRIRGVTEGFRAVEILGPEHDAIVTAYREKLGRSVDGYFKQIPDPADHPVFRIEPVEVLES